MNSSTVFTPAQIHLLRMFEQDNSEQGMEELKSVLYAYYSSRLEERLDAMWTAGELDQQKLDAINMMDLHQLN
ncbi:MAG: hypothetical protein IJ692_03830 [Alloprevotella sp.]|nr:hypothetical protein [Alloprevotella sp.]